MILTFIAPCSLASMFQHIPSREFSDDLQTFTPPVFAKPAEVISIPESAVEEPKPAPIVETPGVAGEAKEPENAALAPNEALETPKVEAKLEPATRGRPGKVQAESIVLAVVDHTSTVVYYRIWDGIVPPKV